jgi:hypothetical protein
MILRQSSFALPWGFMEYFYDILKEKKAKNNVAFRGAE